MNYRVGCVAVEAIDTYVRVTVSNIGGIDAAARVAVTKHQCPTSHEVAQLVQDIRGYWPDNAVLIACGRAADDAKNNKIELAL